MNRLLVFILPCVFLAAVHSARAGPASPCDCSLPCGIVLGGTSPGGVPDPAGTFTVVTRDLAHNPWSEGPVTFDFSGCPDVSICSAQVTRGVTVTCDAGKRTVAAMPDPHGVITLTLVGGVAHRSSPASAGCLKIYAAGVILTDGSCHLPVTVSALDESGGDGLTVADLSLWLADALAPTYLPRSDFDHAVLCENKVGPSDLSLWLRSYFGAYVQGCNSLSSALCP